MPLAAPSYEGEATQRSTLAPTALRTPEYQQLQQAFPLTALLNLLATGDAIIVGRRADNGKAVIEGTSFPNHNGFSRQNLATGPQALAALLAAEKVYASPTTESPSISFRDKDAALYARLNDWVQAEGSFSMAVRTTTDGLPKKVVVILEGIGEQIVADEQIFAGGNISHLENGSLKKRLWKSGAGTNFWEALATAFKTVPTLPPENWESGFYPPSTKSTKSEGPGKSARAEGATIELTMPLGDLIQSDSNDPHTITLDNATFGPVIMAIIEN